MSGEDLKPPISQSYIWKINKHSMSMRWQSHTPQNGRRWDVSWFLTLQPRWPQDCLLLVQFLVVYFLKNYVTAVDRFFTLFGLDQHVGLFLKRIHNELGQSFIHLLYLAVKFIPDEELLLGQPVGDYAHTKVLIDALNVHPLTVLEGVQHGGVRKAHLPIINENHVLALNRCLSTLF